MGGSTESAELTGISSKKAFYAIYEESKTQLEIIEAKTIGIGSDFEEVTACAND